MWLVHVRNFLTQRLQVLIEGCHQHLVLLHPPAVLVRRRPLLLGVAVGASTERVPQAGRTWVGRGDHKGQLGTQRKMWIWPTSKRGLPTEVIDIVQKK